MADQTPEAVRLADQRAEDMRAQGRREGLDAAHTAEQDRRLDAINGSIDGFRAELKAFAGQLTALATSVATIIAVTDALEKKGVSTRMFLVGVGALLIPIITLVVTLAVTGK